MVNENVSLKTELTVLRKPHQRCDTMNEIMFAVQAQRYTHGQKRMGMLSPLLKEMSIGELVTAIKLCSLYRGLACLRGKRWRKVLQIAIESYVLAVVVLMLVIEWNDEPALMAA